MHVAVAIDSFSATIYVSCDTESYYYPVTGLAA